MLPDLMRFDATDHIELIERPLFAIRHCGR